jgi:hypothetical protein
MVDFTLTDEQIQRPVIARETLLPRHIDQPLAVAA